MTRIVWIVPVVLAASSAFADEPAVSIRYSPSSGDYVVETETRSERTTRGLKTIDVGHSSYDLKLYDPDSKGVRRVDITVRRFRKVSTDPQGTTKPAMTDINVGSSTFLYIDSAGKPVMRTTDADAEKQERGSIGEREFLRSVIPSTFRQAEWLPKEAVKKGDERSGKKTFAMPVLGAKELDIKCKLVDMTGAGGAEIAQIEAKLSMASSDPVVDGRITFTKMSYEEDTRVSFNVKARVPEKCVTKSLIAFEVQAVVDGKPIKDSPSIANTTETTIRAGKFQAGSDSNSPSTSSPARPDSK